MVLPYTEIRGYLPLGADLLNGTMTLDAAKILCNSLSSCMGFTLSAAAARHPHTKHVVWLKAADEWVGHNEHLSFIKNAPACTFEVKRYKKAAHGPYCCEGASCPDEDKYAQLETTCALPSATPNGMPRCSALRGTPLVNVAHLHGLARMSSEYPYSENSGPRAGNDGVIDKRSLVHTQCEGGPQWWRLTFSSPMHIVQLVRLTGLQPGTSRAQLGPGVGAGPGVGVEPGVGVAQVCHSRVWASPWTDAAQPRRLPIPDGGRHGNANTQEHRGPRRYPYPYPYPYP